MFRRTSIGLFVLALLPGLAGAAPAGKLKIGDKAATLTSSCAIVPRFDMQGWGKPEVTLLMSDQALDCAAIAGWGSPDSGAFEQAVKRGRGSLVSISFQPGLKLGKVSVYAVGTSLGNDACEGCQAQAAYAGAAFKGSLKTAKPLKVSDTPITFDLRFDLAKPAAPAPGEKLAGGGDPGKAYLAYLKAFQDGDYPALQKLMPQGEAEDKYGYHDDAAARRKAIQGDAKAKAAKVLEAWRNGSSALLIVEVPSPFGAGPKIKALVGLGLDGTNWRVREERPDFGGMMFKP